LSSKASRFCLLNSILDMAAPYPIAPKHQASTDF
jgi:hypothetical protein